MFKGHRQPIACMDTDPKGTILYTAGQDKAIIAWDIAMGSILKVSGEWQILTLE